MSVLRRIYEKFTQRAKKEKATMESVGGLSQSRKAVAREVGNAQGIVDWFRSHPGRLEMQPFKAL